MSLLVLNAMRYPIVFHLFLLLGSIFTLFGCGEAIPHTKEAASRTEQVCSKPFRDLFANFDQLASCQMNTCCIVVSDSKQYKEIDGSVHQELLANYEGPVIALGYLPDTLNSYALVYCTAAAIYLPNLALYDRSGELIQTVLLASGCGSDVGYHCKEVVVFDGKNQFITTKREKQYEIDQTGMPNKKVAFEVNSKIRFTVNERQISIDTLQ